MGWKKGNGGMGTWTSTAGLWGLCLKNESGSMVSKHTQKSRMMEVERCSLEVDPTSVLFIWAIKDCL